ncbi:MAG: glucose-6-phosphate dehydrogenase [Acidobacteria bacterium]|nr:glucose-6-phosphate dehydrogenase [Acidobacteriota bacterium]
MPENRTDPCVFAVFGATGDLNRRKLLPALYHLAVHGVLGESQILGVARDTEMNDGAFRELSRESVSGTKVQDAAGTVGDWCDHCVHYRSIGEGREDDYRNLRNEIEKLEKENGLSGNRVFYLALPPQAFPRAIEGIGRSGLNRGPGWTRVVVEKPFGHDLSSSQELNALTHHFFDESQIYRIDHYLGKETVQNLLVLRFANPIFESVWNRDRIENVQITVAEELGVEKRAGYYDRVGALRDMVQNHLTQVLTLICMEVPAALRGEAIRDEKRKVLASIAPIKPEDVVFGQYTSGRIGGRLVPGYRDEAEAVRHSKTETAVALKIDVANWRWQGVPFYLRTGKRMPRRVSKAVVTFKCAPVSVFQPFAPGCSLSNNVLVITIQPDEGFDLQFQVKTPGQPVQLATQKLHFDYAQAFSDLPDGYETLLLDILNGDQTLFVRSDWVDSSWRLYEPLLQSPPAPSPYAAGTWGPSEADRLLAKAGHAWFPL